MTRYILFATILLTLLTLVACPVVFAAIPPQPYGYNCTANNECQSGVCTQAIYPFSLSQTLQCAPSQDGQWLMSGFNATYANRVSENSIGAFSYNGTLDKQNTTIYNTSQMYGSGVLQTIHPPLIIDQAGVKLVITFANQTLFAHVMNGSTITRVFNYTVNSTIESIAAGFLTENESVTQYYPYYYQPKVVVVGHGRYVELFLPLINIQPPLIGEPYSFHKLLPSSTFGAGASSFALYNFSSAIVCKDIDAQNPSIGNQSFCAWTMNNITHNRLVILKPDNSFKESGYISTIITLNFETQINPKAVIDTLFVDFNQNDEWSVCVIHDDSRRYLNCYDANTGATQFVDKTFDSYGLDPILVYFERAAWTAMDVNLDNKTEVCSVIGGDIQGGGGVTMRLLPYCLNATGANTFYGETTFTSTAQPQRSWGILALDRGNLSTYPNLCTMTDGGNGNPRFIACFEWVSGNFLGLEFGSGSINPSFDETSTMIATRLINASSTPYDGVLFGSKYFFTDQSGGMTDFEPFDMSFYDVGTAVANAGIGESVEVIASKNNSLVVFGVGFSSIIGEVTNFTLMPYTLQGGFYGYPTQACVNQSFTFNATECTDGWGDTCNYQNTQGLSERLTTMCGNTIFQTSGAFSNTSPTVSCNITTAGVYNFTVFLQSQTDPYDLSIYNPTPILINVSDALTCTPSGFVLVPPINETIFNGSIAPPIPSPSGDVCGSYNASALGYTRCVFGGWSATTRIIVGSIGVLAFTSASIALLSVGAPLGLSVSFFTVYVIASVWLTLLSIINIIMWWIPALNITIFIAIKIIQGVIKR